MSRGVPSKVYAGRPRPEVQHLTLLYTIFERKNTYSVFFPLTNSTPFTYLVENVYRAYALFLKHEENHNTRKSSRLFHSTFKSFYSWKDRFPTLLYTSTGKIPTLSYTWGLKMVPPWGGAFPYRPLWEVPPPGEVLFSISTPSDCKGIDN